MSSQALVLRAEVKRSPTQRKKGSPSLPQNLRERITGVQIRRLRLSLRWTQSRLGIVICAHRSTVSRWECERLRPSASRASRLVMLSERSKKTPGLAALAGRNSTPLNRTSVQQAVREALLTRLQGRRVIASVSGGKDSAAMSLYLHELGIEHERVFLDTGWESPITYEYLQEELPKAIGPRVILAAGGKAFQTADPTSWSEQTKLAAADRTDDLKALQEKLKAGRTVSAL